MGRDTVEFFICWVPSHLLRVVGAWKHICNCAASRGLSGDEADALELGYSCLSQAVGRLPTWTQGRRKTIPNPQIRQIGMNSDSKSGSFVYVSVYLINCTLRTSSQCKHPRNPGTAGCRAGNPTTEALTPPWKGSHSSPWFLGSLLKLGPGGGKKGLVG